MASLFNVDYVIIGVTNTHTPLLGKMAKKSLPYFTRLQNINYCVKYIKVKTDPKYGFLKPMDIEFSKAFDYINRYALY